MTNFIEKLEDIIKDRKQNPSAESYTSRLIAGGIDRVLKKIGEEAGELIIATKNHDKTEIKNEAADLIFHLLIVLQEEGLSLKDVTSVLEQRHKK